MQTAEQSQRVAEHMVDPLPILVYQTAFGSACGPWNQNTAKW